MSSRKTEHRPDLHGISGATCCAQGPGAGTLVRPGYAPGGNPGRPPRLKRRCVDLAHGGPGAEERAATRRLADPCLELSVACTPVIASVPAVGERALRPACLARHCQLWSTMTGH